MGSSTATTGGDDEARRALEELVVDNEEFERLEAMIAEFNIFEALGVVRRELRHSDLLAFLLDPRENHGLGDRFLRRLLQRSVANAQTNAPFSPVELDVWEFDDADVRRERHNIDILIIDGRNKLAVIIENKIDSGEHSDQLRKYWDLVINEFPDFKPLGIFLSPDGDDPTDERYIPVDYGLVADLVRGFTRSSTITADVGTLLRHYEQMLRRHIVSDSDIADLCRKLYKKHKHAFDLILLHRPDPGTGAIRELAESLVHAQKDLTMDESPKTYLRFAPREWDVARLREGRGWTKSGRILLFEIAFTSDRVFFKLTLGPGPAATRERLFKIAQNKPDIFRGNGKTLSAKWHQLHQRVIVDQKLLAKEDSEALETAMREQWAAFAANDLPSILAAFRSEVARA